MQALRGTVTGSISGVPYNVGATIKSYYLTNNTGGSITVNISLANNLTGETVKLFNTTIASNATEKSEVDIYMPSGFTVYISTSGSCDYWFTLI